MRKAFLFIFMSWIGPGGLIAELKLDSEPDNPVQAYAVKRLQQSFLRHSGWPDTRIRFEIHAELTEESYQTRIQRNEGLEIVISSGCSTGLLYGALDLIEQLKLNPDTVQTVKKSARFPFRAIKFNLPFMSYRRGNALALHEATCRDLKFWEAYLDMMADNRFNSLTLWSLHPFHLMIRNEKYPEACELTDAELAEWQMFWRSLFAMAQERGIDTYVVNWNIIVSPAFARHHKVAEYSIDWSYIGEGDRSEIIGDYMRTTVTQLLDTYPNLTGLGVSLGERMGGMTPKEREQWVLDVFVDGIQAASRPARFIHRLPFSADKGSGGSSSVSTEQMTRQAIESIDLPGPIITEAKFNWSHGHSTPKLIKVHGGKLGDTYWNPPPENYAIHWMIRNEDFFALRWCEPDFIRKHIQLNGADYVGGYYIGSECYIPAADYITVPERRTGYAFERQWLFYMVWGRLLYDSELTDDVFIRACQERFGAHGETLFTALTHGSKMPLRLASFFNATWDFTLYCEGFMSNQAKSNPERLITVNELIKKTPLEPDYLSIKEFVDLQSAGKPVPEGRMDPLRLAEASFTDGSRALSMLEPVLRDPAIKDPLALELVDAKAWAHLSIYFAEKLRSAVALHRYRKHQEAEQGEIAVAALKRALLQWELLVATTESSHRDMPLAHIHTYKHQGEDTRSFHWKRLLPAVKRELNQVVREVNK
ncbi:MAG: hypothetical protein AAF649_01540 [Verrucomicrobiota bacterium]